MMNTRTLVLGILAAVMVAIGIIVVAQRKAETSSAKEPAGQPATSQPMTTPVATQSESTPAASPTETPAAESGLVAQSDTQNHRAKPMEVTPVEPSMKINGYEVQDPLARVALAEIGSDPAAEAYWIGAINDSSLPAEERKDLIEDLNEDGLSDPRHPSVQDMPLILRRIRLIEQLAPSAMDDVNRDALAEAYKDLVGLANGQAPQ